MSEYSRAELRVIRGCWFRYFGLLSVLFCFVLFCFEYVPGIFKRAGLGIVFYCFFI